MVAAQAATSSHDRYRSSLRKAFQVSESHIVSALVRVVAPRLAAAGIPSVLKAFGSSPKLCHDFPQSLLQIRSYGFDIIVSINARDLVLIFED